MYDFNYHPPGSVADAVAMLAANEDAKLMAGGQTFLPTLKQRLAQPTDVIDLGGIAELKGDQGRGRRRHHRGDDPPRRRRRLGRGQADDARRWPSWRS